MNKSSTLTAHTVCSNTLIQSLICLVSGAAMSFAFAPFQLFPIAILCLTLLLVSITNSQPKQAFQRGLLFGLGLYGAGVWWVYIAIRYFGNAAPMLAVLLTVLLVGYMALFPATLCALLNRWFPASSKLKFFIAFPALWALFEWLRGWLFTGFPWLFAGYSQLTSPLSGFAPIGGIYLLSFLCALSAAILASVQFLPRRTWSKIMGMLVLLWGVGYGLQWVQWTSPTEQRLTVSLLQGNIGKELKWNPKSAIQNIETYHKLTQDNWDAQFIVWPESTFNLTQVFGQRILDRIDAEAKKHHATVNIGLPYLDEQEQFYNALMLVGVDHGQYFKRHLVPFGEYTPLNSIIAPMLTWLKIPMSDFSAGSMHQPLLKVQGMTIAPYICYEIVYPGLVRRALPQAQILMTISEDAWYGDSNAVDQHLEMAQMRSLESGRWSLFAVNTGISAIINARGQITQQLGMNQQGVIRGQVPGMQGRTPWVATGDWFWLLLMLIGVGVSYYFTNASVRRNPFESSHR